MIIEKQDDKRTYYTIGLTKKEKYILKQIAFLNITIPDNIPEVNKKDCQELLKDLNELTK